MQALSDLKVLDLSRLLPGPFCTLLLADLGADVIKIEDTDGGDYLRWMPPLVDRYSALFHALNRNKRSVALNLKIPSGRAAFLELVKRADVVVEGFRPGVLDRLQVGYGTLREQNRRVVLCSITGYGQDGPYHDRAGHDVNYAALAGVLSLTGCSPEQLAMPGVQAGDLGGGALGAAVAILAALRERDRTGEGQHCDVSMLDGLVSWMAPVFAAYYAGGEAPGPGRLMLNGRHPCYRLYRCADGYMSVGALEPKFWQGFVQAIGLDHLSSLGFATGEEAARVVDAVQAVLATKTREQWSAVFDGRETCCEPVLSVDEAFSHPQVRSRQLAIDAGVAGPAAHTGMPFRIGEGRLEIRRRAPGYGEHSKDILAELGYDDAGLARLVEEGATIAT